MLPYIISILMQKICTHIKRKKNINQFSLYEEKIRHPHLQTSSMKILRITFYYLFKVHQFFICHLIIFHVKSPVTSICYLSEVNQQSQNYETFIYVNHFT